jgi:hypothetical protein
MSLSRNALRTGLVLAAVVAAAAHVPVVAPHLDEAPYMGVLFILFSAGCLALAGAAVVRPSRAVYVSAAGLCGAGIVTYAATRLVAFPQLSDDVGSWFEPLGVISVLSEYAVVLCAAALLRRSRPAAMSAAVQR